MKKLTVILTVMCMFVSVTGLYAADIDAGKARSGICAGCHGAAGISPTPAWPNLAGQHAAYLEKQLQNYKSGVRTDAMMQPQAKMLSDADMANLAAYYASLSCK